MKPAPFAYHRAADATDALAVMAGASDAAFLSGGQSLAPMLNLRMARPALLIDLNDCAELSGVTLGDGGLRIGALTRHHHLATDATVRSRHPLLAEAAATIGSDAIRRRGTLGGSLAHADPAAQLPLIATLCGAVIALQSARGARMIEADDFFVSALETAREPNELVVAATFPDLAPATGWGLAQLCKVAGDFAVASAAATLALDGAGAIVDARLAVGAVCDRPMALDAAGLRGARPGPDVFEDFAMAAVGALDIADAPGIDADDRRDLAAAMIVEAMTRAAARAGRAA
ncbi:MAG: FAD binding domain-containing protein [Methylobacteriaceae bacterium]|nr:FAD binding domain-containing protein [Methylobacteriaceae bacterium]